MLRSFLRYLTLVVCMVGIAGCGSIQSFGVGPWPIYTEPQPLEFSDTEKQELATWAAQDPALFRRIQNQEHSYRAIVREHNKQAREMNLRQLRALGYDDETLRRLKLEP